ncbi:hypothetical protein LEMLEM_LOCUS19741, partial [Lemmus lemmus]
SRASRADGWGLDSCTTHCLFSWAIDPPVAPPLAAAYWQRLKNDVLCDVPKLFLPNQLYVHHHSRL